MKALDLLKLFVEMESNITKRENEFERVKREEAERRRLREKESERRGRMQPDVYQCSCKE